MQITRTDNTLNQHFESASEFYEYTARTDNDWQRYGISADSSRSGSEDFTGSKDWPTVHKLATLGWPEGRDRVIADMLQARAIVSNMPAPSFRYDVAGAFPHIGRAVAGAPDSMVLPNYDDVSKSRPVVRICTSIANNWTIQADSIERHGIALLSAVEQLEDMRIRCEIVAEFSGTKNEHGFRIGVTLKHADQHYEPDRMAYALSHPSFFRRHMFAAIERVYPAAHDAKVIRANTAKARSKDLQSNYSTPNTAKPSDMEDSDVWLPSVQALGEDSFKTLEGAIAKVREVIYPQLGIDLEDAA